MTKPNLIDLFCGGGGATKGYQRAGFYVIGVDIEPQPNYCGDEFIQGDALEFLASRPYWIQNNAVHASPPCHDFTSLASISGGDGTGWMLPAVLWFLRKLQTPWIVENVDGAPLPKSATLFGDNAAVLCGSMFDLQVLRHRTFLASFPIHAPEHGSHEGLFYSPAGHGEPSKEKRARFAELRGEGYQKRAMNAMGIDWMGRDDMTEAIPPAYTEWLGKQMLDQLKVAA